MSGWPQRGWRGVCVGGGGAYINYVDAIFVVGVDLAIREQSVGEQRQQHKLGECQELVARQDELGTSGNTHTQKYKRALHEESTTIMSF